MIQKKQKWFKSRTEQSRRYYRSRTQLLLPVFAKGIATVSQTGSKSLVKASQRKLKVRIKFAKTAGTRDNVCDRTFQSAKRHQCSGIQLRPSIRKAKLRCWPPPHNTVLPVVMDHRKIFSVFRIVLKLNQAKFSSFKKKF